MKVSDYIYQRIAAYGTRQVFFLPGGGAMHLVDSLGRTEHLQPVSMLHEQAAVIAAEAYARVTNELGVATVTTGPGGTNAITGVAGAWIESSPCLIVSGQVKRADMIGDTGVRQMGVQEVDIISLVRPITKYACTVMEPETIRYHLEKAIHLATHGRPGPVWLDIPLDVQAALVDPDALPGYTPNLPASPNQACIASWVAKTCTLLRKATRPVILAGNGVRLAGALDDFHTLVDRLGIPVLTTRTNGVDLLPYAHPLYVGRPGAIASRGANFALQNADCLLVLGAGLDLVQTGYNHAHFAPAAVKIIVDIDEAEIRKLQMAVAMPAVCDVKAFIRELSADDFTGSLPDIAAWRERCREWKRRYPIVTPEHRAVTEYVSTYVFSEALTNLLAEDAVTVIGSSGQATEIFTLNYQAKLGQRAFLTGGLGAMGFGLPAGIGAAFACGRDTVLVDGDGGFQLNIQELATVAHYRLPIKIFLMNNAGYASIRNMQRNHFQGHLVGSSRESGLPMPDTSAIAAAYGLPVQRIATPENLEERLQAILDTPGPVFCEVMLPPDEARMPTLSSSVEPDGTIVSRPLEDLWPFLDRDEFRANMSNE